MYWLAIACTVCMYLFASFLFIYLTYCFIAVLSKNAQVYVMPWIRHCITQARFRQTSHQSKHHMYSRFNPSYSTDPEPLYFSLLSNCMHIILSCILFTATSLFMSLKSLNQSLFRFLFIRNDILQLYKNIQFSYLRPSIHIYKSIF